MDDLKQHAYVLLSSGNQRSEIRFTGPKSLCRGHHVSSRGCRRESIALFSLALECVLWISATSSTFNVNNVASPFSGHIVLFFCMKYTSFSLLQGHLRLHLWPPHNFPNLNFNLITSTKTCHHIKNFSLVPGIKTFGGQYSVYHSKVLPAQTWKGTPA